MNRTKEDLYKLIGGEIFESIEGTWQKAQVVFEIIDVDVCSTNCTYETSPGKNERSFSGGMDLIDLFLELHLIMADEGLGAWSNAIYRIDSSGMFDLAFEYGIKVSS